MKRLSEHALHTTLRFPCVAGTLYVAQTAQEIPSMIALVGAQPFRILGGGSNVLCASTHIDCVIQIAIKGVSLHHEDEHAWFVEAGAGEAWHELVLNTLSQGWAGLENLALIPGWVGAAPVQNIGAYGVEIEQRIHSVRAWDCEQTDWVTLNRAECQFAYRDSIFKRSPGRYLIVSVVFRLPKLWQAVLSYQPLKAAFSGAPVETISPLAVCNAVIAIRQSKLPDPAVIANAGSFFKNPVVSENLARGLREQFPTIPSYPQVNGMTKLAAGWLIEQCGWKGRIVQCATGSVGVHSAQALVLVNHGGAVGNDLLKLATDIEHSVQQTFGVVLEREVNVW